MSLQIFLLSLFFIERSLTMIEEQIKKHIEEIRPSLQADGGDISFVSFDQETSTAYVQLQGACHGCPMAQMTLKQGVERYLKENIEGLNSVESV